MTDGYRTLRERMQRNPLPPWHERLQVAFWRGSTLEAKNRSEQISTQLSISIGAVESSWPDRLDARFNRVVQCRDAAARDQVKERLQHEQLLSPTVEPWHAGLHAWQIDIDGNVNSWELLWKLLSIGCVLRVEEPQNALVPPAPSALGAPSTCAG